jgi:hypothetical protein
MNKNKEKLQKAKDNLYMAEAGQEIDSGESLDIDQMLTYAIKSAKLYRNLYNSQLKGK